MRRLSWVWLAVGTALSPFINFQTAVPVAACCGSRRSPTWTEAN
jgi:hypothetical protein